MTENERLTEKTAGCFGYDLKDLVHNNGEFADYNAFYSYNMAVKRLGEYEDVGTIEEFKALKEKKPKKKKSNKVIFTHDSYAYCPHCKNPVHLWNRICANCSGELDWK